VDILTLNLHHRLSIIHSSRREGEEEGMVKAGEGEDEEGVEVGWHSREEDEVGKEQMSRLSQSTEQGRRVNHPLMRRSRKNGHRSQSLVLRPRLSTRIVERETEGELQELMTV
jgi:hypothetical protein